MFSKQARKLGKAMPDAILNPPFLRPWLAVFWRAFHDLMWDRYDHEAHIPWMARQQWATVHGLDAESTELLHLHVLAMDRAFLVYMREKRRNARTDKKAGQKAGQKPVKRPTGNVAD